MSTITGIPIPASISRADLIARANKLSSETLPYNTDLQAINKQFLDTVEHYQEASAKMGMPCATVGELLTNANAIAASARQSESIGKKLGWGTAGVTLGGLATVIFHPDLVGISVGIVLAGLGFAGEIVAGIKQDAGHEAAEEASTFGQHVADLAIFMGSEQAKPAQAQPPSDAPIMYSVGMHNGAC